jgi:hypothetical protein
MGFTVTVQKEFTDERVKDLLCCGMEGGCGYWAKIKKYIIPEDADTSTVEFKHIDLPFIDGCGIHIVDNEDGEEGGILNRESMQKGLEIMGTKYPFHLEAFVNENEDAETGDVFIQCAVLGDIVFG